MLKKTGIEISLEYKQAQVNVPNFRTIKGQKFFFNL